jgi:hypothetical protein
MENGMSNEAYVEGLPLSLALLTSSSSLADIGKMLTLPSY